nr:deoxyribonuclease 2-2 [Dugesia japonica]
MNLVSILLILNIIYELCLCNLSCKDENNNDVDWFIGLKFPNNTSFVYLSPKIKSWKLSEKNLSSEANMIGLTIKQTFNSIQSNSFYAYYNDEPAKKFNNFFERGHLKGVISFDNANGFWLVHSVPVFPTFETYEYHQREVKYGQSFFCVSLSSENLEPIILQLLMMQSTVYDKYVPVGFPSDKRIQDLLHDFVNNINTYKTEIEKSIQLTTHSGLTLQHFGKSHAFNKDLYDGFVAPALKTSILVESWIRGHKINSSCESSFKVYNVHKVTLFQKVFSETDDHSKWVVSKNVNAPYVCVGDINRMTSQFKRGGGTLCVYSPDIWAQFSKIVYSYENCTRMENYFLPKFIL